MPELQQRQEIWVAVTVDITNNFLLALSSSNQKIPGSTTGYLIYDRRVFEAAALTSSAAVVARNTHWPA
ncbi:hypothetical protein EVAR_102875_1 [Eumeta japonica]|uniref:Uncharacterized protein n=1 Tax=Eumeta variegata TaxID=151549 RepID=A0A4C1UMG0_EUMVA|nr:hypothetical protein EVAR_102875_1 [Eumeta japonica]